MTLTRPLLDTTLQASSPVPERHNIHSLAHGRLPFKLNIRRIESFQDKVNIFFSDIFQSFISLPRVRFFLFFIAVYFSQYFLFAFLYYHQPDSCIEGVSKYLHAVWFSVQTSRTIGYGSYGLSPNPDCTSVNVYVMIQCTLATFLDTIMFGIVLTRFTNPMLRPTSIKFSRHVVLYKRAVGSISAKEGGGTDSQKMAWCLTCRMANIRAHGMLGPRIKMLLMLRDKEDHDHDASRLLRPDAVLSRSLTASNLATVTSTALATAAEDTPTNNNTPDVSTHGASSSLTTSIAAAVGLYDSRTSRRAQRLANAAAASSPQASIGFAVHELHLPEISHEMNKLTIGFPCSITHVIDKQSPLYGLSLEEMEGRGLELFLIVEGIDPSTSHATRAMRTYRTDDILVNRVFGGVLLETKSGQIGVRMADLDTTTTVAAAPTTDAPSSSQAPPISVRTISFRESVELDRAAKPSVRFADAPVS